MSDGGARLARAGKFTRRHSLALAIALIAIASLRIIATYSVFNHVIDEPAHIACGMEWLSEGTYEYESQHPPLARVMAALLPYLAGGRSHDEDWMVDEGLAILYNGGHYQRTLTLARLGILPFFWLGALVTFAWTRRGFGEVPAVLATLLFTCMPPILAQAGLATTDMALAATLGAAFLAMLVWAENPSWKWTVIFGVVLALSVLSKLSALAFFPAASGIAGIAYAIASRQSPRDLWAITRARLPRLACAILIACLTIWAGYRFSFDKIPAPEFFDGIHDVREHNRLGHPSYFLGKTSETGFRFYYPVLLAVKTPLALLGLAAAGLWVCWKRRAQAEYWMPVAFAAGVLAVASFSRINIGVRHVLPVYITLAMLGAIGAAALWERGAPSRWILAVLIAWMLASSALSHPDYLAYFNELAGRHPEKIAVDSDLDWGQDTARLGARLRELGAKEVAFDPFVTAHLEAEHGFPPIKPLDPNRPLPGWNAVSLTKLKLEGKGAWANYTQPTERIGKGILLFYIPPGVPPRQ
jgi:Dolichyl-phosphate-mannose-protein mannosyltransferase